MHVYGERRGKVRRGGVREAEVVAMYGGVTGTAAYTHPFLFVSTSRPLHFRVNQIQIRPNACLFPRRGETTRANSVPDHEKS